MGGGVGVVGGGVGVVGGGVGVVGVGDPVAGWCQVIVQQAGALLNKHGQVVLQDVARLDTVLDEEGSSHDVVDDVALH